MKKKLLRIVFIGLGAIIVLYATFTAGRYSYLITEPEMFLSEQEEWAVKKAREYATEEGIADDRLKNPKVVETVRVYFGGIVGMGGVEVTMMKNSGQFLECSY